MGTMIHCGLADADPEGVIQPKQELYDLLFDEDVVYNAATVDASHLHKVRLYI